MCTECLTKTFAKISSTYRSKCDRTKALKKIVQSRNKLKKIFNGYFWFYQEKKALNKK